MIKYLTILSLFICLSVSSIAQQVKESFHPKKDFEQRADTTFNSSNYSSSESHFMDSEY